MAAVRDYFRTDVDRIRERLAGLQVLNREVERNVEDVNREKEEMAAEPTRGRGRCLLPATRSAAQPYLSRAAATPKPSWASAATTNVSPETAAPISASRRSWAEAHA